ncbi:MAG: hypothetical protein CM1200mP8_2960 [Chloroflexota bacterium]|nr:MAG: hypothetical protein CM1200mP8_2960 [Chloroflexota bacterium]
MELSLNEVRSIAKLCRIKLTEKELKSLQDDLKNIFEYFSDLDALDTSGNRAYRMERSEPKRIERRCCA